MAKKKVSITISNIGAGADIHIVGGQMEDSSSFVLKDVQVGKIEPHMVSQILEWAKIYPASNDKETLATQVAQLVGCSVQDGHKILQQNS